MNKTIVIFGLLALGTGALTANAQTVDNARIQEQRHPALQTRGAVGNVVAHLAGGQTMELSHTGLASDVKVAPDHKTIAWTEGQIIKYSFRTPEQVHQGKYVPEQTIYVAKRIVVWRNGKRITSIVPKKLFRVNWQFNDGGQEIAVSSAGSQGAPFYQLFDTTNARRLAYSRTYDTRVPSWARGLDRL